MGASTVPSRGHDAARDRQIGALHGARLQLAHQVLHGRLVPGNDQQSARLLVEAVHDAGARQPLERRHVVQERIEHRSRPVAAAGMDHEPRGLGDHQHVRILMDDVERDGFRPECRLLGPREQDHLDAFAAPQLQSRPGALAIDQHGAFPDQLRQARSRLLRQQAREGLVQAQARQRGLGNQREPRGGGLPGGIIRGFRNGIDHEAKCNGSAPRCAGHRPGELRLAGQEARREARLGRGGLVSRRQGGARQRQLARGGEDLYRARVEVSLWPVRAAGAAGHRVRLLQGRRNRAVDRDDRPFREVVSEPPEPRLRALPEGARQLQGRPGHLTRSSAGRTSPTGIPRPPANPSRCSRS